MRQPESLLLYSMKKIITTAFILCTLYFHVAAQLTFVRVDTVQVTDQSVPFKNAWAGGLNFPMFFEIDLNGDSIMDLVAYENGGPPGHNRLMPFINNGAPGQPDYHYAPQYISHFPDVNGFMVTYDYNHDGKMDLFTLSIGGSAPNSGIMVYRNDYTPGTGLQFTMVMNPILTKYSLITTNVFASEISVPAFCDVDNDGDMDIISWPDFPNGSVEYQKGLAVDSGWSFDSLRFQNVTQCWGGFALEIGTSNNRVSSFGNVCRMMEPDSTIHWDKGAAVNDDTQSDILVFDNDGDGLKDALIGGFADNNALYIHNGGTVLKDSMNFQDTIFPRYNVPVNLPSFPSFFYLDADNDGAKDLIVTPHSISNFRGILFYKNTGTTSHPVFALQPHTLLQEDMIDVGAGAAPQLFDYDADGLPDLLIGNESYHDTSGVDHKGITLYRNVGTPSKPKFQLITRDYAGIDALNGVDGTICPTFGDLDGDGDLDMIVGNNNGQLLYFENTAGAGNPANFIAPTANYQGIDVGQYSAPQLYDLNHDGLLDLIVGDSFGFIKYYENTGTKNVPVFTLTKDTLGGIIAHDSGLTSGYASPFFYNDNDTDKLILGTEVGKIYIYDNINGNILGNYHLADSLINGEEGQRLIPFIGDINHDGRPDMLIGNYNGGLSLYMNTDTVPLTVGLNNPQATMHPSFDVFPNPASDQLHITFNHLQNMHATFEMINDIGQLIYKTDITEPTMTIPLRGFSNGIYLVRFVSDNTTQSQKIIVRRK